MTETKIGGTIRRPRLVEELMAIYEKYPEFRGKTPNKLINLAWDEWVSQKLKENGKANKVAAALASETSGLLSEVSFAESFPLFS